MRTNLAIKALNHMEGFKNKCTTKQWEHINNGIHEFDNYLTGSGFYAIQAKLKLEAMLSFDQEKLKAFQTLFPN